MFRVRQVLLRIRIWTHGSVLLDMNPDPDPDPALFSDFQDAPKFFCLLLTRDIQYCVLTVLSKISSY